MAEYFIEELNDDPEIELKHRIDFFYDLDEDFRKLVKKNLAFLHDQAFPDNLELDVKFFRAKYCYAYSEGSKKNFKVKRITNFINSMTSQDKQDTEDKQLSETMKGCLLHLSLCLYQYYEDTAVQRAL